MTKNNLPSADIVLIKELRPTLIQRAKSTGIMTSEPDMIVNFGLFSMLASCDAAFSESYYQMLRDAVDNTIIYTDKGPVKVKNVKAMFVNYENVCVLILENGDERCVLNGNPATEAVTCSMVTAVDKLKLTTGKLKEYILENHDQFPHLKSLTKRIDRFGIPRSELRNQKSIVAELCRRDDFIMDEMHYYLHEMMSLLKNSHFVLK